MIYTQAPSSDLHSIGEITVQYHEEKVEWSLIAMYTITTGMYGTTYHGFPHPMYGAWGQMYHGPHPHHYHVGGTQYNIQTHHHQLPGTFPYAGPFVPFR